ncbi:transcriptional regulator [Sphaerisporangium siamense]|uniref:Putative NBD/HSP70 family sugar kinase/lambda repressor-like putative transcriptional regulator n=1 Tax=Sphaerisporangium siamense TaxID=795645 RepID=A0A7W7D539_9ACTN|nr:ROK family transcriptional regulator [Sphaerisporangium siamense]MBB4700144.1 putative NBD/HSP70 family sugar kinase/lambda repressor-like putative transcriptional regulator [Sphaerisporangium siamense]GII84541.1 transcriptional regulator [Sphaerisporangium siamense]
MSSPVDALQRLRQMHEDAVLAALRSAGALSRAQLTQRTGLSRTTLFAIISDLIERGAVVETEAVPTGPRGRGRPASLVALNPAAGLLLGLDMGRRRVRMAIANMAHQVVATETEDVPAGAGVEELTEAAIRLVRRVAQERELRLDALKSVGVGLVGVVGEPTLPAETVSTRYLPMTRRIAEEFGVRVMVDNNARLAALAEATWGVARLVRDMVYVRWSVGVGGGFLCGGRLLRGAQGAAGELGHVSLDPRGPQCHCGGRGCLEGRVGGQALLEACAARGVVLAGVDALVAAAQDRVAEVCEVVSAAAADLGRVLAGTVTQLDPEQVVIGGELAALGSLVLGPIEAEITRQALPRSPRQIKVVPADLGANASAMGAIALLLHEEPPVPLHLQPAAF